MVAFLILFPSDAPVGRLAEGEAPRVSIWPNIIGQNLSEWRIFQPAAVEGLGKQYPTDPFIIIKY